MNEISLADINGFASSVDLSTVGDPQTKALLLEILGRLANLEEENRQLRAELDAQREEDALERAYDRQRLARLENHNTPPASSPQEGTKTADRIEEMIGILKRRQGRAAFSELKKELKLTDSQFSKLVKKLDMRRFDVQRRPQSGKEKVLILRQQIG